MDNMRTIPLVCIFRGRDMVCTLQDASNTWKYLVAKFCKGEINQPPRYARAFPNVFFDYIYVWPRYEKKRKSVFMDRRNISYRTRFIGF